MESRYDIVVVGAGAVGLAVARRLARAGRTVAVLERGAPGGAASRAAAGMLAPQLEAAAPGPFFELGLAARARFAEFAAELEAETGYALDYRADGGLAVGLELDEESELARRAEWQRARGLAVLELSREEARARWPALTLPSAGDAPPAPRFGEGRVFHFPEEAQVDAGRVVEALAAACQVARVDVLHGLEASGLAIVGDRVTAVRTAQGEVACGLAVNAAGSWAGDVAEWAGEALPVEPVRGEMVSFATDVRPPWPIVTAGGAYGLLRANGRLLVGATVERAGYAATTTEAGQAWLEKAARALFPSLPARPPLERWAGLRPWTRDGLPILGLSGEARGLVHATGHFRNGILLAPITADLLHGILERDPQAEAAALPFDPGRFGARAACVR